MHTNLSYREVLEFTRLSWSESTLLDDDRKGVYLRRGIYNTYRRSFGRVTVSAVTMRRMRYCAKYVVKDNNSNNLVPKYARWSKGYGLDWLKTTEAKEVCFNERLFAYTSDGKPASLDRYYLQRLYCGKKSLYDNIVWKAVFADAPPDKIIEWPLSKQILWHKEHQKMIDSELFRKRLRTFTPIRF